mgnify:CR=1 FL=1
MADGFDRYDREEPLSCSDVVRDPTTVCRCEDGEGPNCPGCLERMAQELAACIDETEETLKLARAVVTARYDADGHAQRKARQALAEQLRGLHRRIVGGEL